MTSWQSDTSAEEVARRGDELYEREIRQKVEAGNTGRIVAIDVDSGRYSVGEDELDASHRLRSTHPHAEIWFIRIGFPAVHRM